MGLFSFLEGGNQSTQNQYDQVMQTPEEHKGKICAFRPHSSLPPTLTRSPSR